MIDRFNTLRDEISQLLKISKADLELQYQFFLKKLLKDSCEIVRELNSYSIYEK